MPTTYSLTVINNSELGRPTFAVFAKLPTASSYETLSMAWLTKAINDGNEYVFTWPLNWGFSWSAQATQVGYVWSGTGHLPADPSSTEQCMAEFSYNGDFELRPTATGPDGEHLWIVDDTTVPVPSEQPSSVAVTLDGNPVCATNAGPNLTQTFTLHPTYFIDAGNYVPGQMVDGASTTRYQELRFEGGNTALTAILNRDNTWTVRETADVEATA